MAIAITNATIIVRICIIEQLFEFYLKPQTVNCVGHKIIPNLSVMKRLGLCEFAL